MSVLLSGCIRQTKGYEHLRPENQGDRIRITKTHLPPWWIGFWWPDETANHKDGWDTIRSLVNPPYETASFRPVLGGQT